ncbi:uncharacterized protein CAP isoform X3 [Epargyreus clarus]|uniref:uncharacterized protein CAP isoform X3 n=1 Tax=Epargyreus clarus TaxID=520877 RepID=UPI003C2E1717
MPDKPKRRKNNKNKKKAKNNNRNNVNKNNSDVNDASSVNSCDCQDENIDDGCENSQSELVNQSETKIVETIEVKANIGQDNPVNTLTEILPSKSEEDSELKSDNKELLSLPKATDVLVQQTSKSEEESENKSDKKEFLNLPKATDALVSEVSNNTRTSYVVETPDVKKKSNIKLNNGMKSKSVDNDDFPVIVEITEEVNEQSENEKSLSIIDNSNVIITDAESDVEWEKTDELHDITQAEDLSCEAFSVTTIPLEIAQCEQTKSLSADQEKSLRCYLQSLDLATSPSNLNSSQIRTEIEEIINREIKHRLRKKGLAEEMFFQRGNISRGLDVIDEEGSSESSATSRRHSYLSDKKSDNDDLEDEVFEKKSVTAFKPSISNTQTRKIIPQQCFLVDAKLKEPDVSEARGTWSLKTVEKITGAEVVYLTDSSSSTSSLYDVGDDIEDEVSDASIRIITPTIEVTDTEKFLTNTFISKDKQNSKGDQGQNSINKENAIKVPEEVKKPDSDQKSRENLGSSFQDPHEIVVLTTDNITTNLTVKDITTTHKADSDIKAEQLGDVKADKEDTKLEIKINENSLNDKDTSKKDVNTYDLEIKVLKCELNDAINNLIKEVTSDSESASDNHKDTYTRQDSSSSVCSSQCTAKYNPNYSSLNDVSNMHEDTTTAIEHNKEDSQATTITSHVKEVFQCVTGDSAPNKNKENHKKDPLALKDLCVKKIASFPFGNKILEELAHVSERLQNMSILALESKGASELLKDKIIEKPNSDNHQTKMPYFPLPDISNIEKVSLSTRTLDHRPPPIQPRKSSLIKSQDEQHWTAIPSATEPVYVCLSPSQKMLMEKTNTVIRREDASQLIDTHKKFVDRRGYNEKLNENIDTTPIVPFKSQTGSRLLALIRDPSVTNNVSLSSSQKNIYKSLESLPKLNYPDNKDYSEVNSATSNSTKFSKTFKPIPPPRPRKFSSSFYESDESSDFTDNSFRSIRSEKKHFHYSTGNLNKEIENDISSIQNMHRYYSNMRDAYVEQDYPRRPSLPKDLCDQQMEYIRRKEKEVEEEIRRLEQEKIKFPERKGPRAPLIPEKPQMEKSPYDTITTNTIKRDHIFSDIRTRREDKGKLSSVFSKSQEELLREKMYSEYVTQMAEREQRRQQKFIKISHTPVSTSFKSMSKSMPKLDDLESKVNNRIEKEFICRARERWHKLGIEDPETEDEKELNNDVYREPKVIEHKIKVIQAGEEKDVTKLPSHLQEFVNFTARTKEEGGNAVWRPGAPPPSLGSPSGHTSAGSPSAPPPPPPPPVWTPGSASASPQTPRKTFRPVHFEDTPPARRKFPSSDQTDCTSGSETEGRLRTSQSAPLTGLNSLGGSTSRLPRAQNPTVTLLQKAREGQLSRNTSQQQQERDPRLPRDRPSPPKGDPVHALRQGYISESEVDRSDYERGKSKMADAHRKVEGIGPTTKDGMPVALRSEVKDPSRWYKKMYDTIHKNKYDEDYVTIRYKNRRGEPQKVAGNKSQYAYFDPRSGYLSEPEGGLSRLGSSTWSDAYDSDVTSGPRRRTASVQEDRRMNDVASPYLSNNKYSTLASARASQEMYKNQPGRIENYVPGKSSVVDKEAKQWWDEVMDIFDGWLDDNSPLPPYSTLLARAIQKNQNISSTTSLPQTSPKEKKDITSAILSKSNMARALKESGYESDSTLIFRRREDTEAPLSPAERRAAYKDLQAGGEPPLRGFRSPAPPRQETDFAPEPPRRLSYGSYSDTESPSRRYVESDVNIHYRCPVRHDPLPLVPERELARQQAEHMKRLYREQKRNKYLQENDIQAVDIEAFDASIKELQDMQNRRHQDNFMPSQKTVVPLNRYDEPDRSVARALYAFNGQTSRELSFRKGDLINVRRQIDSNWYEGEVHGRIGLFPYNYVELLKGDVAQTPKKPAVVEGRARAKFDFTAQTNLELPLKKGEVVVLTRRIDQNWWEGRNGNKTGIFPDSYVTVLQEPSLGKLESQSNSNTDKPVASPAAHGLLNGTAKRSMGSHSYTPQQNSPALANAPPATQPLPGYATKQPQNLLTPSERGYGPPTGAGVDLNNAEPLYVDTNAEAVPYRAMYKYRPQNPDELELNEGDTVYVLEKCDDGWYVGSSQRTGRFGTFPGNYVERI